MKKTLAINLEVLFNLERKQPTNQQIRMKFKPFITLTLLSILTLTLLSILTLTLHLTNVLKWSLARVETLAIHLLPKQ